MRLQVVKQYLKFEYDKKNMHKFKLEMEKNALCSWKFEEARHPTEEYCSPIQVTVTWEIFYTQLKIRWDSYDEPRNHKLQPRKIWSS